MNGKDEQRKGDGFESSDSSAIISSIGQDALREADNLLEAARQEAERRKRYAETQAGSIISEAEERANAMADKIRAGVLSGISIEVKRKKLHIREQLYDAVLNRAAEMLEEIMGRDGYRDTLMNLIIEAGVGLGASSMTVNATQGERSLIDRSLLDEAEKSIENFMGKSDRLDLSTEPPLKGQGVLLSSEDNRVTYNNQMKTRMVRKQREIRAIVHEELFESRSD